MWNLGQGGELDMAGSRGGVGGGREPCRPSYCLGLFIYLPLIGSRLIFELFREKTRFLRMRKQRHRSVTAPLLSLNG